MTCTSPSHALLLTMPDGSRRVSFEKYAGETLTSIAVKLGVVEISPIELPCGKCKECRFANARQWALRIMHESRFHKCNSFITLTYSDDYLPANGSLVLSDIQKFIKRLRARHPKSLIRYYYCGEYGGKTHRPHYHAVIFGYDFSADRYLFKFSYGNALYRSPELESLWPFGISSIGELTFQSAGYVARYILKNDGTGNKGFSHMSLKPGIGALHFDTYKSDIYPSDIVFYKKNGKWKKTKPPRYYDKLLEKSDPAAYEYIKSQRFEHFLSLDPDNNFLENEPTFSSNDLDRKRKIADENFLKLIRSLEETY